MALLRHAAPAAAVAQADAIEAPLLLLLALLRLLPLAAGAFFAAAAPAAAIAAAWRAWSSVSKRAIIIEPGDAAAAARSVRTLAIDHRLRDRRLETAPESAAANPLVTELALLLLLLLPDMDGSMPTETSGGGVGCAPERVRLVLLAGGAVTFVFVGSSGRKTLTLPPLSLWSPRHASARFLRRERKEERGV